MTRCTSWHVANQCLLYRGHDGPHYDGATSFSDEPVIGPRATASPCASTYAGLPCDLPQEHTADHRHYGPHGALIAAWGEASADKPTAARARDLAASIAKNPAHTVTVRLGAIAHIVGGAVLAAESGEHERLVDELRDLEDAARALREEMEASHG